MYAKKFIFPKITEVDSQKMEQFFVDVRRESNIADGIPITYRHLEAVVRMTEAYAKLHLRDHVRTDDVDQAINMLLDSFL